MRTLIVLGCCFVSLVLALPQGYNYKPQQITAPSSVSTAGSVNQGSFTSTSIQGSTSEISKSTVVGSTISGSISGAGFGSSSSSSSGSGFSSGSGLGLGLGSGSNSASGAGFGSSFSSVSGLGSVPSFSSNSGTNSGFSSSSGSLTLGGAAVPVPVLPAQSLKVQGLPQRITPIITKNYYLHAAPDDDADEEIAPNHLTAGSVRKHYRIVFIKAPSQSTSAAKNALRLAHSTSEEKTVIYVLSKKTDLSDLQTQLAQTESQSQQNKPEVYFIKYRTPDEALHAQHQIQAQYDALGGTSQVSDEGFAPVSSVIGALSNRPTPFVGLQQRSFGETINVAVPSSSATAPVVNNSYIPPPS